MAWRWMFLMWACLIPGALGESLGANEADALQKTQAQLIDPQAREKLAVGSPDATAALAQVKALAGTDQNAEAIFQLAASVLGNLAKDAQGNPEKMMEILKQAQSNPAAFAGTFTPQQQQELSSIAKQIPQPGTSKLP